MTNPGGPSDPDSGSGADRAAGVRTDDPGEHSRPASDQPLRAHWDPTAVDNGRPRSDRSAHPGPTKRGPVRRFIATYGWRAYAIPVLIVLTIALIVASVKSDKDGGPAASPANELRDSNVKTAKTPIGAPTVSVNPEALPSGALPDGGPFTEAGAKSYHIVPMVAGTGKQVGTGGQLYTYTVEVENGLNPNDFGGDQAFASLVEATLSNGKSWTHDGKVSLRRVAGGQPADLHITLVSPATTRDLCGYEIKLESSCYYPPEVRVVLNEARWIRGAVAYQGDTLSYRQYVVNHESGHGIGYAHHQRCAANGALAPVMMEQTFGVDNQEVQKLDPDLGGDPSFVCKPNPWPFPNG